jgi:hypothetical protein
VCSLTTEAGVPRLDSSRCTNGWQVCHEVVNNEWGKSGSPQAATVQQQRQLVALIKLMLCVLVQQFCNVCDVGRDSLLVC